MRIFGGDGRWALNAQASEKEARVRRAFKYLFNKFGMAGAREWLRQATKRRKRA